MAVDYQMEPQEAVIAIESDDDGTEESDAEATAAAAALDAEPPRQCLLCQLHIPRRGCTTSQSVGSVSISLGNRGRSLNIRTIPQVSPDMVCIPVESVRSVDVKSEECTAIVSVSPPLLACGFLACSPEADEYDEWSEPRKLSTVALETTVNSLRSMLATLRAWLPITLYGPRSVGLTEPVALRFQGIVLERRDRSLLADEEWLNDTVLDFFLRLAVEVAVPDAFQGQLFVAKTQFFTRLTACGAESGEKGWENVRTWTRSVSGGVASQRYIVYPVNEANLHWWVAVVCHPQRAVELGQVGDSEESSSDLPRIVCFDSAWEPPPKEGHVELLKGYLRRELFNNPAKSSADAGDDLMAQVSRWKAAVLGFEKMEAIEAEVPKQENAFDCGVFSLEFLLFLLRRPCEFSLLGLESHERWFDQALVTHRRTQLREIVARLEQEAQKTGEADVAVLLQNPSVRSAVVHALMGEPDLQNEEASWSKTAPSQYDDEQREDLPEESAQVAPMPAHQMAPVASRIPPRVSRGVPITSWRKAPMRGQLEEQRLKNKRPAVHADQWYHAKRWK